MTTTTYLSAALIESAGILLLPNLSQSNPTLTNSTDNNVHSRGRRPTRQALFSISLPHHQTTTTTLPPSTTSLNLSPSTIRICAPHNPALNETVLPEGRRDIGKTRTACALRECWVKTGVRAGLLSHPMMSRQRPVSDAEDVPDMARILGGMDGPLARNGVAGEGFIVQLRTLDTYTGDGKEGKAGMGKRLKIVYWYLGVTPTSASSSPVFQPAPYTFHGNDRTKSGRTPIWISPAEDLSPKGDREAAKAGMEILEQMERKREQKGAEAQLDGSYEFVEPSVKEVWTFDKEMSYEPSTLCGIVCKAIEGVCRKYGA